MACLLTNDLRDAVLQYALEGCLTRTLNSDTPVNNTIELYKQEKESILTSKNMKDRNSFSDINNDEILFNIPETWSWIRINDIGVYKKGPFGSALTKSMFVKKDVNTVKVYEQKNAIQKDATLGSYYITEEYYNKKMKGFSVVPGDIIVSCAGTIGEIYIVPEGSEMGIINQALMRMNIVPSVNIDYFMLVFNHILKEEARKNSGGTAIKNIPPFEVFKAMPIPIPPIEEQARIVAKVDEIMAKIDEYEKLENQLVKLKEQFPQDMKESLLQAGMMGKLTEHLETDTPVKETYILLKGEKDEEKRKKSRQGKLLPVDLNSTPFEIPNEWLWLRNSEVTRFINGRAYKKEELLLNGKYPILRVGNLFTNDKWYYSNLELDKDKYCNTGDLLYAWSASFGPTIWHGNNSIFHYHIWKLDYSQFVNKKFLYYSLLEDTANIKADSHGLGFVFVTKKYIENRFIPFPPIEEQQRIVDKLDELLPLVEHLSSMN